MSILGFGKSRGKVEPLEVDDLDARAEQAARDLRHAASNVEQMMATLLSERDRHRRTGAQR